MCNEFILLNVVWQGRNNRLYLKNKLTEKYTAAPTSVHGMSKKINWKVIHFKTGMSQ